MSEIVLQKKADWEPPVCKELDQEVWQAWLSKGREKDRKSRERLFRVLRWILFAGIAIASSVAVLSSAINDLSRYRDFKLGSDLSTVATQAGVSASQAKSIHLRPALIQELEWRPRALGWSDKAESVQLVVFTFYNSELYRIVVTYDHDEIEGMTAPDVIQVISASYGAAATPPALSETVKGRYGDQERVLARWQDTDYRFDLVRTSQGFNYRLIGVRRALEEPVEMAIQEALRLDDKEAPQREAAKLASEEEAAKAKLEKTRMLNKAKFRH
jgi:hypothetical protein